MSRMSAPTDALAIDAADLLHSRGRNHSARDAGLSSRCPPRKSAGGHNGARGSHKSKDAPAGALSDGRPPARTGHPAPPPAEELVPHVTSSRLCPGIVPLALERVDSSYRFLHLLDILEVCNRLRKVLSRLSGEFDPLLAELIGECANGKQLAEPKVVFVPLASVGHPQADGRLLAMGLALRKKTILKHRRDLSAALERVSKKAIILGRFGTWRLEPDAVKSFPKSSLSETWMAHPNGATDWATVTPIVLGEEMAESAASYSKSESSIRLACRREGLPEPCEIIVIPVSAHFGAPPADAFPCFQRQGSKRLHRHAILIFPEPIRGPVLLGAGSHGGYGLCLPMAESVNG
jgi:CRISPR-associated protein Csb2